MKHLRLLVAFGILGLVAAIGALTLVHAQNEQGQASNGRSYLTTVKDSNGSFASRGVITLHADKNYVRDRFRTRRPSILL